MSTEKILEARASRYGDFIDNATIAQAMKMAAIGKAWIDMDADAQESIDMICTKISRIVTADWRYVDNWRDIEGFAKLVADRLEAEELRKNLTGH
jgi:hypothetical protein